MNLAKPRFMNLSLRVRLIVAIVLTTLPLMAVIWFGAQRQFKRESMDLQQEVQRLNAFVAGDVNHLLEVTRQMLVAVAGISRATTPEQGRTILADLARQCPRYTSFGVVDPARSQHVVDPLAGTASALIDQALLTRARNSGKLVIGAFQPSPPGERNLLAVAYAVASGTDTGRSTVAFVVLDLEWLDALLREVRVTGTRSLFPSGMILNILDRSGTILTRHPDKEKWAGKKLPDTKVLDEILSRGEGAAELTGVDGISRYYAFQAVQAASDDIYVCTGVYMADALLAARTDLHRSLMGVSAIGLLLVVAAWFGTGVFITRPVASLVDATQRLGAGDLSARVGATRGPREITHLAAAFDRMAETLQHDARERERLRAKLVDYDRQLRSMTVQSALAEEQERRQIAAGLHDKAGPLLAACFMKLGRALKLPSEPGVTTAVTESRDLIDQAIGELRSLTFDLSSPALYTLGLPAAVEEVCRDTAKHHSLNITFLDQGTPPDLTHDQRVVLYRAARELLLNVVKHAEATRVTVTCGGDAEEVFVAVVDDGVGFDAADAGRGFSRTGGFGLFNLRERLAHLGGRFTVESSRGAGTRIVVALPVTSVNPAIGAES